MNTSPPFPASEPIQPSAPLPATHSPARALELLFHRASQAVADPANRDLCRLPVLEKACRHLARDSARRDPPPTPSLGFDRAANLYVVSELYQVGGHRALLERLIASRPHERHVVIFTGALTRAWDYGLARMAEIGAFALYPDREATLYDSYHWLRHRVMGMAAHRVFLLHHPQDVLATAAAYELAPRYGRRLYMVRHADTCPSLGGELTGATHLAIRREQVDLLKADLPELVCHALPLSHSSPSASPRAARTGFFPNGVFTTTSAGGDHKFQTEGALGLPQMLCGIIRASQGRHLHLGAVSPVLQATCYAALESAQIPQDRLQFLGDVPSIRDTLDAHHADLFLASFPIGGGLTTSEVAAAGVPIALYDPGPQDPGARYRSGAGHRPAQALVWTSPEDLFAFLRRDADDVRLMKMSQDSAAWYNRHLSPDRFARRLAAILRVSEPSGIRPAKTTGAPALFDALWYGTTYPDVGESQQPPLSHYQNFGQHEGRQPHPLFDPAHYLAQLSETERPLAKRDPLTHYFRHGEARGYKPHPLFDPALTALQPGMEKGAPHILLRYLALKPDIRTHSLFDGSYYARQIGHPDREGPALAEHFLTEGAAQGLSPHPLLDLSRFGPDPLPALRSYLSKAAPAPEEHSPHLLFDPGHFCHGTVAGWCGGAPNLLWAYMLAGNRRGQDPHVFVSTSHVARVQPELLLARDTVLDLLLRGTFTGDTHPLIRTAHIRKNAPWLPAKARNITQYFLTQGAAHLVDPHPYFSTQYYLNTTPGLLESGINPLEHYLTTGQFEGRLPHPFFDGNYYYRSGQSQQVDKTSGPLMDYVLRGAGQFRPVQPHDPGLTHLHHKLARRMLHAGDPLGACQMLQDALHPDSAPAHPSLRCQVAPLTHDWPDETQPDEILPARQIDLPRPAVVHRLHVAPPSGSAALPAQQAGTLRDVTLLGGNDGVLLSTGVWFDPAGRPRTSDQLDLRTGGSVVARAIDPTEADKSRILLRYHQHDVALPAGIFACSSQSHDLLHVLFEVLPRVKAAEAQAPKDLPILIDDQLAPLGRQALRDLFPHRPLRQLGPGQSYQVGTLYFATPSCSLMPPKQDRDAPKDAALFHPKTCKWLNSLGAQYAPDPSERRRICLHLPQAKQTLLNAAHLHGLLYQRGFDIIDPTGLSFEELIRLVASAEILIAPHDPILAALIFARPGTQIYICQSDAPGSNYYLWDSLTQEIGLSLINIGGTHAPGSGGETPDTAGYTLAPEHILPFLDAQVFDPDTLPETLYPCLDALYQMAQEADTLTAAWAVMSTPLPPQFDQRVRALRQRAGDLLQQADIETVQGVLAHPFFAEYWRRIRSGMAALRNDTTADRKIHSTICDNFRHIAEPPKPVPARRRWRPSKAQPPAEAPLNAREAERLLALAMLFCVPWDLPLVRDLTRLPLDLTERYLNWLAAPQFLFRDSEDAAYVTYAETLLTWGADQLNGPAPQPVKTRVYRTLRALDLGQLLLIDQPLRKVARARNRVLDQIAITTGHPRATPRDPDGPEGRIRIGVFCRTFAKGPDSEAVVAFFKQFDPTRYEIYGYSVGFQDRVVSEDDSFAKELARVIPQRRVISEDPHDLRATLLADELDVFLHANATTYGLGPQELTLYHRVAPLQMVMNSHVPMPFGFDSFDGYITGTSDDPEHELDPAAYAEPLLKTTGPVICYLNSLKPRPKPLFDRAALGLAEDDVVLMNAGSLSKLRHSCLRTLMQGLVDTPKAKLLLAPFNPGWVARSQALVFDRQLEEMAEALQIDRSRIHVMGELNVAEAESALALCDIYLNPFPHGGATMTHLALINGKPPVTLRRQSSRAIDQFLIQSIGIHEVLAKTPEDYIRIVTSLAQNATARRALSEKIREAARTPPFVDNPAYSQSAQALIDRALTRLSRRKATHA